MNRRDLFRPETLAHAAGQILGALEDPPDAPPPEPLPLLRLSRRAMATMFEVLLPFGTPNAVEAAETALDEIDRLEAQLTVYRDSSEVSRLNRHAASGWIATEPRLFDLLALSARLHAESEGAFDIAVGPLIKAWGFYRRRGRVPADDERAEVLQRCGMANVRLDPERRAVRFERPGVEINLGSIGKGYALDRAAALMRERWSVASFLLHGGGSSVLARGSERRGRSGWSVGVKHPWDPARRLAVVWLRDRALATSAATFQHLEYNGRKLGHILDLRTGWPADRLASATAVAPTAAEADALATAFFVQGEVWAQAYCAARPDVGAVLLRPGSGARTVVVGLAPDEIDLAK